MEVINDLVGFENRKIFQNTDWFNFSLDSVLLGNFVRINKGTKLIVDFCCGNCPIPLILSTKTDIKIVGVEIQSDLVDLANKSINYNNLSNQIYVINDDINNAFNYFDNNSIDIITCNPPYFKYNSGSHLNDDEHKVIARHEKFLVLDDIFRVSKSLLKTNGSLYLVHRTERLMEIIKAGYNSGLILKTMQFVYPKVESESNLVLLQFRKGAREGVKLLAPIFVHENNGDYRKEILDLFK